MSGVLALDPARAGDDVMVEVDSVHKRFGATRALRGVSCTFARTEFVALLGPNGAGKSTILKILDGVYTADAGSVRVRGGRRGLGVVHQDLGLVEEMTVAENMYLGRSRLVNPRRSARRASAALEAVGLSSIDPHQLVSSLSLGQRAMVAVARAFEQGAETVVIDEVTAGLHPKEARWVVERLRVAAELGATVLMVTHKLDEVVGVASRYVVLCDGEIALDTPATATTKEQLIEVMSRDRREHQPLDRVTPDFDKDDVVVALDGVSAGGAGPLSVDIPAGFVTALTGPLGSGLHEIAYVAAGLLAPDSGRVVMATGLRRACVPAHRESEGVMPTDSVEFNLTIGGWRRWRGPLGLLDVRTMRRECQEAIDSLAVTPRRLDIAVADLSGGNQQKALLGRALMRDPDLLVLCEPTRGVDVATRREIYARVRERAAHGTAVLVASTDYEDIAALADAVGVIDAEGHLTEWLTPDHLTELTVDLA